MIYSGYNNYWTRHHFFSVNIFLKVLLTLNVHQMSVTTQVIHTCKENKTNKFRNYVMCNKMEWHREKVLKNTHEERDTSWNWSVIRKESHPSSVEINIRCFSPNTYSTRMMKMKQGWTFQQDNDHNHSQGKSQLVSEKENKAARMAQPITWLESNIRTNDQSS